MGRRLVAALSAATALALAAGGPAAAVPSSPDTLISADQLSLEPEQDAAPAAERGPGAAVRAAAARDAAALTGRMIHQPTEQQLSVFYPQSAKSRQLTGTVRLACRVALTTQLEHCVVREEYPHGYFFADAALQATFLMRVEPAVAGGKPVDGAAVIIPVTFKPPPLAAAAKPQAAALPPLVQPTPPPKPSAMSALVAQWWPALLGLAAVMMLLAVVLPKLRRRRPRPGHLA